MLERPARWALALLIVWIVAPGLNSDQRKEKDVADQIDSITAGPEYDWLRTPKSADGYPSGATGKKIGGRDRARLPARPSQGGCRYEPGSGYTSTPEANSGCGASEPGSCDWDPSLADCQWNPRSSGCGCSRIGASGSYAGYVLLVLFLMTVVFFVVWLSVRNVRNAKADRPTGDIDTLKETGLSKVPNAPLDRMMELACAAAEAGDFKAAVGWTYLGGIGSLHRAGHAELNRSTTNEAIVESTKNSGGPHEPTARLIRIFEDLFFGNRSPQKKHFEECRKIVEEEIGPGEENSI